MPLGLQPITYREACRFVATHHRHHRPAQGVKFCIGLNDTERLVGVVMVGRPIARAFERTLFACGFE